MPSRAYIFAAVTFALGLCVGLFIHVTGYDTYISTLNQRIGTQQRLIDELQAERREIDAVLRESAKTP